MEHDSEPLVEAYGAIEELLGSVLTYVKVCIRVNMPVPVCLCFFNV